MNIDNDLIGMYRAKVVDNKDPSKFGRVLLWIPDVMPLISDTKGIWARPANNPVGGRNSEDDSDNHYMGSSYIPRKGSWVFVFFEMGNINRPYYFGALDLENTKVLPECQQGSNNEDKWVLFKSNAGRCIVVSDDEDDERVEITGKKRELSDPPSGDWDSVYKIDNNQTVILLDEVNGRQKLLIRTYKGDYIHVDIDQQKLQCYFANDILIETGGSLHLSVGGNINVKAEGNVYQESGLNTNIKSGLNTNIESKISSNLKSGLNTNIESNTKLSLKSLASTVAIDGLNVYEMTGLASTAIGATSATPIKPSGDRKT